MTSPDRRRRQLTLGLVIVLFAILSIGQAYLDQRDEARQDKSDRDLVRCVEKKFRDLSEALDARSDSNKKISSLETRKSDLTTDVMLAFSEAAEHPEANNQADLISALLKYKDDIGTINARLRDAVDEREKTPLPPYPVGACDQEREDVESTNLGR